MIQARTRSGNPDLTIQLDDDLRHPVTPGRNAADRELNVNERLAPYLAANQEYIRELAGLGLGTVKKTIGLKEVNLTAKRNVVSQRSANLNGPGNADRVFAGEVFKNTPNLGSRIKQLLPPSWGLGLIIVDGSRDADLSTIDPATVESVEVLHYTSAAIYGSAGYRGVTIVTTRRNKSLNYEAPGIVSVQMKGFSVSREFYAPISAATVKTRFDVGSRTTVYWNPDVLTNAGGEANFQFKRTPSGGQYRVVLEGIANSGRLLRAVYRCPAPGG